MVEEIFKESLNYRLEYVKIQEGKYAIDLIRMKEALNKEIGKMQSLRSEIQNSDSNWRKVTGDIIANEIELRTNEITKKSGALQVGKWELGDIAGNRVKDLEKLLRDIVRLKRDT
jgi:hypothetical protein